MKNRILAVNLQVGLRVIIVAGAGLAIILLGGAFLSTVLDILYRITGDWGELFNFLSRNRFIIIVIGGILGVIIMGNWILAPIYNGMAGIIGDSLQTTGESKEIRLSRSLKSLENSLNNTNRELRLWQYAVKEAEQRKDDLVVYLAHDIRTPLTSVLGYLELLDENPDLPAEQRKKFSSTALRKAGRMQTLVEELFEITRFNIGRIELEKTWVNPGILLNQLAEELGPVAESRGISVEVKIGEIPKVFVDPEKMARTLDNVLHNAAYYTPRGGSIQAVIDEDEGGWVRFRISNTGMDIPQEKLDRFFEKFYRGDEARQTGSGGSGLGLAIAKNIVEAHGGIITAQNQNKVTTFTILLPGEGPTAGSVVGEIE